MSLEQLNALLEKINIDEDLQEKFKGAEGLDTAVALAKDAGFDVTQADFIDNISAGTELSDEQLEAVTGGAWTKSHEQDVILGINVGLPVAGGAVIGLIAIK